MTENFPQIDTKQDTQEIQRTPSRIKAQGNYNLADHFLIEENQR